MNRMMEDDLRCQCLHRQDDWDRLLPSADFAHNSTVSEILEMFLFAIDLKRQPRILFDLISAKRFWRRAWKTSRREEELSRRHAAFLQSCQGEPGRRIFSEIQKYFNFGCIKIIEPKITVHRCSLQISRIV